ncbi:hypothetical protein [uncultured Clostridium sp.]|uniref:hypothetical protein n=1 Tax=uncultured Clostridium sp. TaxID=59620 RepID=UPI0028F07048|nr:hypothetical protein [uncultured Clostridium sp.]
MGFKVNSFIDKKMSEMPVLLQYAITPTLVKEAKEKAYWKDRSTHARNGINGGVEGANGDFTLYLAHGTEYGEWLENGTGIYGPTGRKIVPVNKKILSWVDADGQRHFAKSVKGIKPMPILHDTLENNKDNIANAIIKHWSE